MNLMSKMLRKKTRRRDNEIQSVYVKVRKRNEKERKKIILVK